MQPNEIIEVLNRPISQELLARDVTRLAYVAKDGTPRNVPIAFTWNGSHIVMCTTKNAPNSRGHPRAQAPETTAPVGETHLSVWRTVKLRLVPPARAVGQGRNRLRQRHLDWELHRTDPASTAPPKRAGRSVRPTRPPAPSQACRSGTPRCPAHPARSAPPAERRCDAVRLLCEARSLCSLRWAERVTAVRGLRGTVTVDGSMWRGLWRGGLHGACACAAGSFGGGDCVGSSEDAAEGHEELIDAVGEAVHGVRAGGSGLVPSQTWNLCSLGVREDLGQRIPGARFS